MHADSTSRTTSRGTTVAVSFHGVRGSTPCDSEDIARYGGNTSCVTLAIPDHDPILFDLGTGSRYFGLAQPADVPFRGHALLSHLHWDHIQGLPFFTPILRPNSTLSVYGPAQDDGRDVGDVLRSIVRPPLFPIVLAEFPAELIFYDVSDTDLELSETVSIMARLIPHVGPTCGYRVTWAADDGDHAVTYISDHQMPYDGSMRASDAALELVDGCDLLIHDSQYTPQEFARKSTWGHCTIDYAVWLAAEAGAKRLALFHHDPLRCDESLDLLAKGAMAMGERLGVEVFAASEGLTIDV